VGLGAGLNGSGKSRPCGVRIQECLSRSESLYTPRYPGRMKVIIIIIIIIIIVIIMYLISCHHRKHLYFTYY
jgi:hypothetical protein